ncbi:MULTISPECIES: response regulator transcription factor [Pseudoalteromonas]|uniref:Response regulator transcription factor n=1 Tax=Pseudoalteromonas obscura TaxID=3048491 RepID=A0ABT7EEB7_9GAMM|nr:response regulator transcription factor [Pseudoalteromonas sp. P94(2023)]MBQ4838574.1 response regulator transcription factor [Pseudoalteromonas luteoviolacea]MDK2593619.1 response regulator transcription factor [Pseudoalteromonas sp. P94(2023)]
MHSLLLIEDDEQLAEVTCAYLELTGFKVDVVNSAKTCWDVLQTKSYALMILDLGLPDEDGLVLLRKLKSNNISTPIIISSGRGSDEDRIAGLEFGASDYLAKPYTVKELLLRINLLIDATSMQAITKGLMYLADKKLDIDNQMLLAHSGEEIELTYHEQAVLFLLAKNAPRTYSREEIIDATRLGEGPESIRAVDTIICRLRKKIEINPRKPQVIKTKVGVGYKIIVNARI